jgi:hypothetical protein
MYAFILSLDCKYIYASCALYSPGSVKQKAIALIVALNAPTQTVSNGTSKEWLALNQHCGSSCLPLPSVTVILHNKNKLKGIDLVYPKMFQSFNFF